MPWWHLFASLSLNFPASVQIKIAGQAINQFYSSNETNAKFQKHAVTFISILHSRIHLRHFFGRADNICIQIFLPLLIISMLSIVPSALTTNSPMRITIFIFLHLNHRVAFKLVILTRKASKPPGNCVVPLRMPHWRV